MLKLRMMRDEIKDNCKLQEPLLCLAYFSDYLPSCFLSRLYWDCLETSQNERGQLGEVQCIRTMTLPFLIF